MNTEYKTKRTEYTEYKWINTSYKSSQLVNQSEVKKPCHITVIMKQQSVI